MKCGFKVCLSEDDLDWKLTVILLISQISMRGRRNVWNGPEGNKVPFQTARDCAGQTIASETPESDENLRSSRGGLESGDSELSTASKETLGLAAQSDSRSLPQHSASAQSNDDSEDPLAVPGQTDEFSWPGKPTEASRWVEEHLKMKYAQILGKIKAAESPADASIIKVINFGEDYTGDTPPKQVEEKWGKTQMRNLRRQWNRQERKDKMDALSKQTGKKRSDCRQGMFSIMSMETRDANTSDEFDRKRWGNKQSCFKNPELHGRCSHTNDTGSLNPSSSRFWG